LDQALKKAVTSEPVLKPGKFYGKDGEIVRQQHQCSNSSIDGQYSRITPINSRF
jgi:hypothetical protein